MTSGRLVIEQPYDGVIIGEVQVVSHDEADAMLNRAVAVFAGGRGVLPTHKRIAILRHLANLMRGQVDEFALLIAREGGKPLTDARIEAARAVNGVELAIEALSALGGREIPMDLTAAGTGRRAFTRRLPIGPVVAVSAFNHPLNLIVHQVVPAIATGCPVIIKPAGTTPLTCLKFIDLIYEAGLPKDWCQTCLCDIPTAEFLVTDPRVAFLSFIGSAKVGWHLRSKLAPGTRCALEHGGVAPVVICDDADIDAAVPLLVKGGYYHAGQVCVSVQRIFVDNKIKARFTDAFVESVRTLQLGDPTRPETEVGPLILPREVDRVASWVDEAVGEGARVLTGGKASGTRMYEPTVIDGVNKASKLSTQEIFGPVTCLYGFNDLSSAIQQANALPVAFQAAVFAQDLDRALDIADRLDGSAVMINDHTAFRVDWMPFAGLRTSGYGVGGIQYTMEDMTYERLTVIRS